MAKLSHEEAFARYLALGAERSLPAVQKAYRAELGDRAVPNIRTFEDWSARYQWVARAEEFDAKAGAKLVSRLQTSVVTAQFDRVKSLTRVAQSCLDIAGAAVLDPEKMSAQDVRALTSTAIDAIKAVELLTGGVTERTERLNGLAGEAQQLLSKLERQKQEAAKKPVKLSQVKRDDGTIEHYPDEQE